MFDFSKTMYKRRKWSEIFKVLRENIYQPSNLYSVKLSFKSEKEIMTFSDKQKFGDFVTSRTALQEMVKEAL